VSGNAALVSQPGFKPIDLEINPQNTNGEGFSPNDENLAISVGTDYGAAVGIYQINNHIIIIPLVN